MRNKGKMKRVSLWLEDDLTDREKQVEKWLESIVKEEKKNGLETNLGYMKIKRDSEWREKEGRLEMMNFREKVRKGEN